MAAYVLANVEPLDPEDYQEYVRRNTGVVEKYGGRFVVRGGKVQMLEGAWNPQRVVLIEFPNGEMARTWYNSPDYQEIIALRQRNARTHLLAIIESS